MSDPSSSSIETYLELPHTLEVEFDVLGREFATQVGSTTVRVRFPCRSSSGKSAFLEAPTIDSVLGDSLGATLLTEFVWGRESSFNKSNQPGSAWIYGVGLGIEPRPGKPNDVDAASEAISTWWPRVCDWVEVLTGQVHEPASRVHLLGPHQAFWVRSDADVNREFRPTHATKAHRLVGGHGGAVWLTADLFTAALRNAPDEAPAPRLLVRHAKLALRRGSRRLAIIDAGTAAELSITELLRRLNPQMSAAQFESYLDENRMLGNRLKLLRAAGGNPPPDTYDKLVKPRNVAAHEAITPSFEDTGEAIRIANMLVEDAYPLANYR